MAAYLQSHHLRCKMQGCLLEFAAQEKENFFFLQWHITKLYQQRFSNARWLTADEKEKSSKSPPAVRSDGAMLLWPPVVLLSCWRVKSNSSLLDIYLNKVLSPSFDKGFIGKQSHSLCCENPVTQMSSSCHCQDLMRSASDRWMWLACAVQPCAPQHLWTDNNSLKESWLNFFIKRSEKILWTACASELVLVKSSDCNTTYLPFLIIA